MNPMAPLDLARFGDTTRNLEDSIDGIDSWGMRSRPFVHDEFAQRSAGQHHRRSGDSLGVGCVDVRRKRIQEGVFGTQQIGLTIQDPRYIALADLV